MLPFKSFSAPPLPAHTVDHAQASRETSTVNADFHRINESQLASDI
ncbi:hypothetical protein H257_11673 [Aphanomyces astaci]|uniref:Uncharacterized protein n=1 Tax=Aphanomyces astaci TaxID=112090 RepID=W4G2S4_APHAT|nr:hypothetical protein H257_11673 [Aphanomyces astaci]ETV73546.1 hypothetical protein H257_11673 [Aphanomyces astaci]|eukprot:XP_009836972.1 hypothetical protein H257_11673 [Aphanomyces astaci]